MKIPFTKMNGAGNDFVMIDNRDGSLALSTEQIRRICERKRGVGGDGAILVEGDENADFRMRYYNSDGGEAEMCGNGARCVALFAARLGIGSPRDGVVTVTFDTKPGLMKAVVRGGRVTVAMTDAVEFERGISLRTDAQEETIHTVNTGVPHAVVFVEDWDALTGEEVIGRGRAIRMHERFSPYGINANFVRLRPDGILDIRTYERGVESETLACGTGSVAAAVAAEKIGFAESPVRLCTRGGDQLKVAFNPSEDGAFGVTVEGPAAVNFEGILELAQKE
jgi:diaminopimelate epimerase